MQRGETGMAARSNEIVVGQCLSPRIFIKKEKSVLQRR
jgi:hypothetical protein